MITRSLKLNLKLVYQLTQRMMICLSKCRPLNNASTETNRRILPSSFIAERFAPEPAGADGSNPVQVTTQKIGPLAPRWSPDGKRFVVAQRPGGNVDVYIVDAQGGTPRRM